ncbi:MAG: TRAP transporter large permease [Hyphomicrobiales bacterium]
MSEAFLFCIATVFGLAAIGTPIAYSMIAAAVVFLAAKGQDLGLASEQIVQGLYSSFILLAVPLFIVAANIMNAGTISERLLTFCVALVGRFRGGLAQVNVVASVIFSGMSGSAIADAAGIGKIIIEMMTREGRYSPSFAAAITAASATIGPIIPPSIPMVLYALVSDTSIGFLFLAGLVPGLMMASALMIMNVIIATRRNFPIEERVSIRQMPGITFKAFPALLMPAILLYGIYGGVTTPTEAAAVAALYALVLAAVFYRALTWRSLYNIFLNSAKSSATIGLIIGAALIFNYIVATERIPDAVAAWLQSMELSRIGFMLALMVLLLLLGCLLDAATILLVIVPLFLPAARELDIDLVHFGVVIVVNTMIGLITPPYGLLLFVINATTGIPLKGIIRDVLPFLFILIVALLIMVLVPDTVLWLPRQFGYVG